MALHSRKVEAEKDAFVSELLANIPDTEALLAGGAMAQRARRLHERFIPVHILSHYRPRPGPLKTDYPEMILSHSIECECLFVLGFYNAGMILIRAAVESAIRLVYYETHPIEWRLHQAGSHNLHGNQYREFLYSFPGLGELPFHDKASLEVLWAALCQFVHSDLRAVSQLGAVGDIKSVLGFKEPKFVQLLDRLRDAVKVVVACCLSVDPNWLSGVEKVYFDAVLDIFSVSERREVKERLHIT